MNTADLFNKAIETWRINKGIGSVLCPYPLNDKSIVLGVLQRIYARSPTCKSIIIVNTFVQRMEMIDFLTEYQTNVESCSEFKNLINDCYIRIVTSNSILNDNTVNDCLLTILYQPESICDDIIKFVSASKFKLVVLNKLLSNGEDMSKIYKLAPMLNEFKANEIEQARTSTPVEETLIGITIPANSIDEETINKYNEYIATSIAIFGSFDIMQKANTGDANLNISSRQICNKIAQENGWHEHLDMNVQFNVELDALYNPECLKERAALTYNMIRDRAKFLTDYEGKLDKILDIVHNNPYKKILIISKRGEFASKVTDYINDLTDKDICMNYHDKVDPIEAIDINGNPVYYKSGSKKGQRKLMGFAAQKSLAEQLFNLNKINVISTNNAPDKALSVDVDIVIITSPLCEDINAYLYRLSNVQFKSNKIELYTIYCRNTMEHKVIEKRTLANNHNVKNSLNDENNYDFIVDD